MELITKGKNRYIVSFNRPRYEFKEQEKWCEETYGRAGSRHGRKRRWRLGWAHQETFFHFRNEKDATWFMMKWT